MCLYDPEIKQRTRPLFVDVENTKRLGNAFVEFRTILNIFEEP